MGCREKLTSLVSIAVKKQNKISTRLGKIKLNQFHAREKSSFLQNTSLTTRFRSALRLAVFEGEQSPSILACG